MQWDNSKNHGFSSASSDKLYLPLDPAEDAPTVEAQKDDPNSLLNTVKALTKLRHENKDLRADSGFEVIYAESEEFPFVFRRGDLIIGIKAGNPDVAHEDHRTLLAAGEDMVEQR